MRSPDDTIFALASAAGRAGVAVMRISGPEARLVLARLCKPETVPEPRMATRRRIVAANGETVDHALVLWFPAPHSFTGEDVVEIHLHGGRAILHEVTEALRFLPRFRLAEPGEFTRRAFEHDKLDLTEAEAIADLVDAETTAQRRQALRQLEGELGHLYRNWSEALKRILAHLEASIDFVDDELPADLAAQRVEDIRLLLNELTRHLDDRHRGERLREGLLIAILGPPNAGKSSLLNALARREAAIVAPTPGTTRDVVEVHLDLGGYPVTLADTAGLRESADAVESEGVRRARSRADQADFKLLVFDGAEGAALDPATLALRDENTLIVINKVDCMGPADRDAFPADSLFISATAGEGLPELADKLSSMLGERFHLTGQPSLTRARHRAALEECRYHLARALESSSVELCAEDVRLALRALGRITGAVDVEDLLDMIFKDFCIGK